MKYLLSSIMVSLTITSFINAEEGPYKYQPNVAEYYVRLI